MPVEDLGPVPSTSTAAHNCPRLSAQTYTQAKQSDAQIQINTFVKDLKILSSSFESAFYP